MIDSYIEQLVNIWLMFNYYHERALDKKNSYDIRSICVSNCEHLMEKRYKIINKIDEHFENNIW